MLRSPYTLHLYNPPQREPSKKAKNAMRGSSDGLIDCWIEPGSNECYLKAEKVGSNGILCFALWVQCNTEQQNSQDSGCRAEAKIMISCLLRDMITSYDQWSCQRVKPWVHMYICVSARDWRRNMAKRKLLVMQPLWTNRRPLKWHVSPNWRWPLR